MLEIKDVWNKIAVFKELTIYNSKKLWQRKTATEEGQNSVTEKTNKKIPLINKAASRGR